MKSHGLILALIIIVVGIIIFTLKDDDQKEIMPDIYYFGPPNAPLVTILAGTHGSEPAPAIYLNDYIENMVDPPTGYRFAIVPIVNKRAFEKGVRHLSSQPDINRTWPDNYSINEFLRPLIEVSSLVVDFHEAAGFSSCQPTTLGQTLYSNTDKLYPLLDATAEKINQQALGCMAWSRIDTLPPLNGTLDNFCRDINKPYILVELTGQKDTVPLEIRMEEMQILLNELLGL